MSLDRGEALDFLPETKQIREGDWKCGPIPADIQRLVQREPVAVAAEHGVTT